MPRLAACGVIAVFAAIASATEIDARLQVLSDAPDPGFERPAAARGPATYREALAEWTSAEAVNAWLGAHFVYDPSRAAALSETARAAAARQPAIHEPEAFFDVPRGVCVDLARFGVASLRAVDPTARAAYLMIEFEPVRVSGQTLRRHWMATFQREGSHYFFADSKRPGHLAGPYASVDDFIAEYGAYRGRSIVSYRVADGYERRQRQLAPRALRDERTSPAAP